eukprot:scaffold18286_cov19-Tisochrysis_lutea.AAC.1
MPSSSSDCAAGWATLSGRGRLSPGTEQGNPEDDAGWETEARGWKTYRGVEKRELRGPRGHGEMRKQGSLQAHIYISAQGHTWTSGDGRCSDEGGQ